MKKPMEIDAPTKWHFEQMGPSLILCPGASGQTAF